MEDDEMENDTAITREPEDMIDAEDEDEENETDDESETEDESEAEDENEDMDDDEDGTEDREEYEEDRKDAVGRALERSIKEWKNHVKKLESIADPNEETNEPVNALSDLD
jgi:hypothetical protein